MKKIIFLLLFCLLITAAQTKHGKISGRIIDEQTGRQPIENVNPDCPLGKFISYVI